MEDWRQENGFKITFISVVLHKFCFQKSLLKKNRTKQSLLQLIFWFLKGNIY